MTKGTHSTKWVQITLLAALVALLLFLVVREVAAESPLRTLVGVPRVVDGDTLEIEGTKIRLHAIDTPEVRWPSGKAAKAFLESLVNGQRITCFTWENDRYNRRVGQCVYENQYLGDIMLSEGWALYMKRYEKGEPDPRRILRVRQARSKCIGIWSGDMCANPDLALR